MELRSIAVFTNLLNIARHGAEVETFASWSWCEYIINLLIWGQVGSYFLAIPFNPSASLSWGLWNIAYSHTNWPLIKAMQIKYVRLQRGTKWAVNF